MIRFRLTWEILLKGGIVWFMVVTTFYFFYTKEVKPEPYAIFDKNLVEEEIHVDNTDSPNKVPISIIGTSDNEVPIPHITETSSTKHFGNNTKIPDMKWVEGLPVIYMITPTYKRAEQIPELTRTAQTLLHVRNLFWIVVEDAPRPTQEVVDYLRVSGLNYVYLRAQMPKKYANHSRKPRGVANRNAGIQWIRKNVTEGVVYFGDDDNTYDLRIFEEIRSTKRVSMFPVGLVTKLGVSSPIVKDGKVIGFYDGWIAKRKFPVDMAGFAINVKLFLENPTALMPFSVGYEEDGLLKNLKIKPSEIEPKAENCSKIWVWHTQTKKNSVVQDSKLKPGLQDTNLASLKSQVWRGT